MLLNSKCRWQPEQNLNRTRVHYTIGKLEQWDEPTKDTEVKATRARGDDKLLRAQTIEKLF